VSRLRAPAALAVLALALGLALGLSAASLLQRYRSEAPPANVATATTYEAQPARGTDVASPYAGIARQAVSQSSEPAYALPEGRMVAVEGYVRLRVRKGEAGMVAAQLSALAERVGGYVGEMSVGEAGGYVVLRIPSERYSEALEEAKKLGEVVEVRTVAVDVTDQWVDLAARLNASRTLERRLLQLLSQAKSIDEVLRVEDYLARVRADIERYEAQLKSLERRVRFSTLRVYIEVDAVQFPQLNVLQAIASALGLLYSVIYALVAAAIGLSPLAALGAGGYLLYRKQRASSRQGGKTDAPQ